MMRPPSLRPYLALAILALGLVGLLSTGCSMNRYDRPEPGTVQRGIASWYGEPFHGRATASGEIYDMHRMTAAHRDLPLGTTVEVTNLDNGRRVRLRVNDRGPFVRGRILDVSYAAAKELGMIGPGTAKIELRVVALGDGSPGPGLTSRYAVQVGAYRNRANARRVADRLKGDFPQTEIFSRGSLHRVRVGTLRSKDAAEDLLRKLRRRGFDAIVIRLE